LGTALYVFYKLNPGNLDTSIGTDQILPLFIVRELPIGIAGLVIAGVFAASQSTLSSSLNSVAAAWMTDFYGRFRPGRPDRANLRRAQVVILATGIFVTAGACLMARLKIASLFDAFISVVGLTGGALAGLFVLGIFTRRAHGPGALVGAIGSVITLLCVRQFTSINFFLFGAIGTLTCVLLGYLASCVLPGARKPLAGLTLYDPAGTTTAAPVAEPSRL
jgi:Na+/proline symporter